MADIKDLDLYGLLELTIDCTEQDIRSAYRKKALKCHPDKNPDDKKAAETFHLLSKAIEILLDKSARDAYDSVIRRKEEVKVRNSKLDSTRKKFKEDLERREKEADNDKYKGYKVNKSEEEILQQEIDRLRKEGSVRLQEEIKLMTEELRAATELNEANAKLNPENYRLRIRWKSKSPDDTKNTKEYNTEILTKIFSKYGTINILVISPKKQGSALLEFENVDSARRAKLYELGFPGNPLKLSYLNPVTESNESKNQACHSASVHHSFNPSADRPVQSEDGTNSESSNLFPSACNAGDISSGRSPSINIFSSQPSPSTNKSSSLFPSANESSKIFSSAAKSSTMFPMPSGLFPSANISSNVFSSTNKPSTLVLSSKKSSQDLDYEQAVLTQMRKAQENHS